MKAFCEKCFKDVEVGPGARCPGCGADLSEEGKRKGIAAEKAIVEGDEGWSPVEMGGAAAGAVGGLVALPFLRSTLEYWAEHDVIGDPNADPSEARGGIVATGLFFCIVGWAVFGIARWKRMGKA